MKKPKLIYILFWMLLTCSMHVQALNYTLSGPGVLGSVPISACNPNNHYSYTITAPLGNNLPATMDITIDFQIKNAGVPWLPVNCNNSCTNDLVASFPLRMNNPMACGVTNTPSTSVLSSTETFTFTITPGNTNQCTIEFDLYLDCSISNSVGNVSIGSNWSTPSGTINTQTIFNLNDFTVDFPLFNIVNTNPVFISTYLQPLALNFEYVYAGTSVSDISFTFSNSDLSSCNLGVITANEWSMDGISWFTFTPGTSVTIPFTVSNSQILRVRQTIASVTGCLTACINQSSHLEWRCANNNPVLDCNACRVNPSCDIDYSFQNSSNLAGDLTINRLLPIQNPVTDDDVAFFDNSCPGTTVNWSYELRNQSTTGEIMPEVSIRLSYSWFQGPVVDIGIGQLSKIPLSSIAILRNGIACNNCTVTTLMEAGGGNTEVSCAAAVPDGITDYYLHIPDVLPTDVLTFNFQTFRCCNQNPDLYNLPKYYNEWFLRTNVVTECGRVLTSVDAPGTLTNNLFHDPWNYYGEGWGGWGGYISQQGSFGFVNNLNQLLNFTPTTADMSVPPGQNFGGQYPFFVESLGALQNLSTQQIVGYNGIGSTMQGIVRVHVRCDQGLLITDPQTQVSFNSGDGLLNWNSIACFSSEPDSTVCAAREYYFYFDLSDPNAYSILQDGRFNYQLTPCCSGSPFVNADIEFDLLTNNDVCYADFGNNNPPQWDCTNGPFCTSCCWLPLSSVDQNINLHCPGCKAPGIIVSSYAMERASYGYQDTDNDGLAQVPATVVDDVYTDQYAVRKNHSSYRDRLVDHMVAFFQDGDTDPLNDDNVGGYTFNQMVTGSGNTNVLDNLQLTRIIPHGAEMDLQIQSIEFYIDQPVNGTSTNCFECDDFYGPGSFANNNTILKACIPAPFTNFLQVQDNGTSRKFFFTFTPAMINAEACSSFLPFTRFETSQGGALQRYRLKVNYTICGNFEPANLNTTVIDDVRNQSEIMNMMWLSGVPQNVGIFDTQNIPGNNGPNFQMPNTRQAKIDAGYPSLNQEFANEFVFYCEAYSSFHYFVSTVNSASICGTCVGTDQDALGNPLICSRAIRTDITSRIGSFNLSNLFPYEFKPSPISLNSLNINVPANWELYNIRYRSDYFRRLPFANRNSMEENLNLVFPQVGPILTTITQANFPTLNCLNESAAFGGPAVLPHYASDEYTSQMLRFYFEPLQPCIPLAPYQFLASDMTITMGENNSNCVIPVTTDGCDALNCSHQNLAAGCAPLIFTHDFPNVGTTTNPPLIANFNPNLDLDFTVNNLINLTNQACFPFTFTNVNVLNNTSADNVFIALPIQSYMDPTTAVATLTSPTAAVIPGIVTPGYILFDLGPVGLDVTNYLGTICFDLDECPINNQYFNAIYGWDCAVLNAATNPLNTCSHETSELLTLTTQDIQISNYLTIENWNPPLIWNTCEDFTIDYSFHSIQGNVHPNNITLSSIAAGLNVQSVQLMNCISNALSPALTENIPDQYIITNSDLSSIGITDFQLSNGEGICIRITFNGTCSYSGDLPDVNLSVITFCGTNLSVNNDDPVNPGNIGPYQNNNCSDCYNCDSVFVNYSLMSDCSVNFTLNFPVSPACSNTVINWDFGDSNTALNAGANVTHTYNASNTYIVSYELQCSDQLGYPVIICTGQITIQVNCDNKAECKIFDDNLGSAGRPNLGQAIIHTSDGGLAAVGSIHQTFSDADQYLLKLKQDLSHDFDYMFGDHPDYFNNEMSYSVIEATDGYYVAGYTPLGNSNSDIIITKFDINSPNSLIWCNTYDFNKLEVARKIIDIGNNEFVVTGYTTSNPIGKENDYDIFLMKIKDDGTVVPNSVKFIGTEKDDEFAYDIIMMEDKSGFIVTGEHRDANGSDILVLKTDLNFNLQIDKVIDGGKDEVGKSLEEDNGLIYLSGYTNSLAGDFDICLLQMPKDLKCEETNTRIFGNSGTDEFANDMQKTSDRGLIIVGSTGRYEDINGLLLRVKLDIPLEYDWSRVTNYKDNRDWFNGVDEMQSDNYVAWGTYEVSPPNQELFLVESNLKGESCCLEEFNLWNKDVQPKCQSMCKDYNWDVKYDKFGLFKTCYKPVPLCGKGNNSRVKINPVVSNDHIISIQPNPNNGSFEIHLLKGKSGIASVKTLDMQGRTIYAEYTNISDQSVKVKIPNASEGVYFIETTLTNGQKSITKLAIRQ